MDHEHDKLMQGMNVADWDQERRTTESAKELIRSGDRVKRFEIGEGREGHYIRRFTIWAVDKADAEAWCTSENDWNSFYVLREIPVGEPSVDWERPPLSEEELAEIMEEHECGGCADELENLSNPPFCFFVVDTVKESHWQPPWRPVFFNLEFGWHNIKKFWKPFIKVVFHRWCISLGWIH